jgi:hypothetical protein
MIYMELYINSSDLYSLFTKLSPNLSSRASQSIMGFNSSSQIKQFSVNSYNFLYENLQGKENQIVGLLVRARG